MRMAVDLGKKSVAEPNRSSVAPLVGVVVVKGDVLVDAGHRGMTGEGEHAEYGVLATLKDSDLTGSTVFTTLEPCSSRNHPKVPCARHLIDRGVATVFIGMYDPNPRIYRMGWKLLRDAGVNLRDFGPELRAEIHADNQAFIQQYQMARGVRGTATFDYLQNGGKFKIGAESQEFETQWTMAGKGSIHAYDSVNNVAHARYAAELIEIDDPSAYDFSDYSMTIREGEIVIFRNDSSFLLVKVEQVHSGPRYGDDYTELSISYEIRSTAT